MKSSTTAKRNRLGPKTVERLVKDGTPGWHNDGGNLYLKVSGPGRASWAFRYQKNGKRREPGIGAYPDVTLAAARDSAHDMRQLLRKGIDPMEQRHAEERQKELAKSRAKTFRQCAEQWLETKKKRWARSYHYGAERRLIKYAYPLLGDWPIREIDNTMVLRLFEDAPVRLWETKPITANVLQRHLEEIFDLANARGYRNAEINGVKIPLANPASWKGNLEHTGLQPLSTFHKVKHLAHIDYHKMPDFIAEVKDWKQRGRPLSGNFLRPDAQKNFIMRLQCLRFMILTTCRPGEAAKAEWSEIDFDKSLRIIPATKMKSRREHIVPLSEHAVELLREQQDFLRVPSRLFSPLGKRVLATIEELKPRGYKRLGEKRIARHIGVSKHAVGKVLRIMRSPPPEPGQYVFHGHWNRVPHIYQKQMQRNPLGIMGYGHITAHGFRASFSTWVNDATRYPAALREFQLAHRVDDATAAAYQRGTAVEKPRELVQAWADYCDGLAWADYDGIAAPDNIVPFRKVG